MVTTAMVAVMTMVPDDGPAGGGGQGESMGKMEEGKDMCSSSFGTASTGCCAPPLLRPEQQLARDRDLPI